MTMTRTEIGTLDGLTLFASERLAALISIPSERIDAACRIGSFLPQLKSACLTAMADGRGPETVRVTARVPVSRMTSVVRAFVVALTEDEHLLVDCVE
jgi:hypothetical protein